MYSSSQCDNQTGGDCRSDDEPECYVDLQEENSSLAESCGYWLEGIASVGKYITKLMA